MNTNEIKDYLKKVFELEKNIYTLDEGIKNLYGRTYNLAVPQEVPLPTYITADSSSVIAHFFISLFGIIMLLHVPILAAIIISFLLAAGSVISDAMFLNVLVVIGIILLFLSIIGVFIGKSCDKDEDAKVVEKNRQLRNEYEQKVQQENLRMQKETMQKQLLNRDISAMQKQMNECKQVLERLYQLNIIHPKYRNFVAVSMIYEYFDIGRCVTFEGHEGAYNIYENEIRLDLVITKIEVILQKLEDIKNNQYMMYNAMLESQEITERLCRTSMQNMQLINEQNAKLGQLADNSNIIAYNSKLAAENTQILKYITLYEKRMDGTLPVEYTKFEK